MLCERKAVMAGGLPGADKAEALTQAGIDPAGYLTISVDRILTEMAARGLIPQIAGLSPLDGADLAHGEAQFLAKRLGPRALGDGTNLLWDINFAAQHAIESWLRALRDAGYTVDGVFAELSIEESVRRTEAAHRRGHEQYRRGRGYGGRYIPPEAIRALTPTRPDPASPASGTGPDASSSASRDNSGLPPDISRGEVTELISSYRAGDRTLAMLSRDFRNRRWPAVPPVCPPGWGQAAPAIDDPEPYVPGSFDDVVRAYDLGWLTDADYEVLAAAARDLHGIYFFQYLFNLAF